ncbi:hypothetical protein SAMN05444167_2530 [Terriglobus roseus]|uniref:Uncharacterized protein n=1 Tax=Terriglobus roseus TaxID=392734 RepID=A0A1G7LGH3_9BACT|nr:hypothetical protein SAMN05444167_2530 [Terriglobus roseus]
MRSLPHKTLVEANIVLREHGQQFLVEGSRPMDLFLRLHVMDERITICKADREDHVTLLPFEEGVRFTALTNDGHRDFLQMIDKFVHSHLSRKEQCNVNMIGSSSNGKADVLRMTELVANGRMHSGAKRIVLQHRLLPLRAEDHVQQHMINDLHGGTSIAAKRVAA